MEESTKDKIQGTINKATGEVKQKVAEQTNDQDLHDEGTADKLKGKVQDKVGDIKKVFDK